jgi:hypothetical protein
VNPRNALLAFVVGVLLVAADRGLATDLRPFDAGSVAAIRVSNAGRPFVLAF